MSETIDGTPQAGVPQPSVTIRSRLTERSEADAERRREGLRRLLAENEVTPTDVARRIGSPSPNAIYNFLNGRSTALSLETVERILLAFPGTTFGELAGWPIPPVPQADGMVEGITVSLEARVGVWLRRPELPRNRQVRLVVPPGFPSVDPGGFGVRVCAPGADAIYRAGTLLACRPLPADLGLLRQGTRLILQRKRDEKIEVSVRELVHHGEHAWLWPRSLHPEHQAPVRIRLPLFGAHPMPGGDIITIVGHVVAAMQPETGFEPA